MGSIWLLLAITSFVINAVIGVIGRMLTGFTMISPEKLYYGWLGYPKWEFKKNAVYWAGQHFKANTILINKKGRIAEGMTILLLLEILFIALWVRGLV